MFYLLLAIFCSTCLLVVFKLIERNKIEKLPVIIVNYFTAATLGTITSPESFSPGHITSQSWFFPAVMLGAFFVVVFYSVALSTQLSGISVTSVAFKLSLVIPVGAAWILYGDEFGFLKISGIILALVAIFLTSKNEPVSSPKAKGTVALLLPAFVFIGSGICDTSFNYIQHKHLTEDSFSSFLVILFFTAGVMGTFIFIYGVLNKKSSFQPKAVIAGILLGIPNYGSAYFMIKALQYSGVEASALWPLNNIGIILLSTATAAILFGERISKSGFAGIVIAIISILLIALSAYK